MRKPADYWLVAPWPGGWLVVVYALACVPLLLAVAPPLLDYPNHLARIWLMSGAAEHPPLSGMYVVDWSQAATNIGVDWLGSQLGYLLPFAAVDRILRLLMFLGAPLGALALARALFGRLGSWHLAPVLLIWTTTTILGFLNYSVAIGAALFCAAALPALHRRLGAWALVPHTGFASILFLIHPFGLLFYLALVTGLTLGPRFDLGALRREWRPLSKRWAFVLTPSVAVVLLVVFAAPHPPHVAGVSEFDLTPRGLLATLSSPVLSYRGAMDWMFCLPVAVYLLAARLAGRIEVHRGLVTVAMLLLPVALLAPQNLGDASMVNRRLPLMIALLLVAGVYPQPRFDGWRRALPALVLAASLGRIAWMSYVWLSRDRDAADMFAVTQRIPPGSAVMVARYDIAGGEGLPVGRALEDGGIDVRRQLPALLVVRNRAFIPTLFAIQGQQPLRVSAAWEGDAEPSSLIPHVADLWRGGEDQYVERWRCDFQYVLLLDTDVPGRPQFGLSGVHQIAASRFAELYAIDPPNPGAPCGPPRRDTDD